MSEKNVKLELFLVRHGESMGNVGRTAELPEDQVGDAPLTEVGKRQALLLGEYFSKCPLDHIFSSGLRRTLNTAYEVASHQPEDGSKTVEVHKIFTECNTGTECYGRTIDEIREEWPCMVSALGTNPSEKIVYYGKDDTDEQLLDRAKEALSYILERFHNGEKVMVAAHAAFNTFLMYAALGLGSQQIFDPSFFNTSITKIIFFEEGTGKFADVHLVYQNAVPHLYNEFPEFNY